MSDSCVCNTCDATSSEPTVAFPGVLVLLCNVKTCTLAEKATSDVSRQRRCLPALCGESFAFTATLFEYLTPRVSGLKHRSASIRYAASSQNMHFFLETQHSHFCDLYRQGGIFFRPHQRSLRGTGLLSDMEHSFSSAGCDLTRANALAMYSDQPRRHPNSVQ